MPLAAACWYRAPVGAANAGAILVSVDDPPPSTAAALMPLRTRNDRLVSVPSVAMLPPPTSAPPGEDGSRPSNRPEGGERQLTDERAEGSCCGGPFVVGGPPRTDLDSYSPSRCRADARRRPTGSSKRLAEGAYP